MGFWSIDKSMGESRISQMFGFVVLLALFAGIIWMDEIKAFIQTLI